MPNPLKLAAMRWTYASVHGIRIQIPWDCNLPQYGEYHFAFAKGRLRQIIGYTEGGCPHRERGQIEAWMKGQNPQGIKVGIDCSGFVYRLLDEGAELSGAPSLLQTLGTACEYTALDSLTPLHLLTERAVDVRAGDTMRFHNGRHVAAVVETVVDGSGRLREIHYAHASFTRGPHLGWIEVGDPQAPVNARSQRWHDEMWDGLRDSNLRDLYFTSMHQSPFYHGIRRQATKLTGVRVLVDGAPVSFGVAPWVLNGHTLCHARPLAEAMGAHLSWEPVAQMLTLTRAGRSAVCQVGSEAGVANGQAYRLMEPPVLLGQSLLVPVRFAGEALGYRVEWDPARLQVDLVS